MVKDRDVVYIELLKTTSLCTFVAQKVYIFWSPATVKSNTIFGKTTLMALEKYSLEIEENLVYLYFGLAWWATATTPPTPMPETEKI